MSAFDHYALACALLGGDRAARLILADLLEDAGRSDLADFARRASHSREADLDLALRLLPAREAVLLGFDYLDHLCSLDGGFYRHQWLLAQVSKLRRLVSRGSKESELAACVRRLDRYCGERDGPLLDEAVQALMRAVRGAAHEAAAAAPGVAAAARHIRESRRNWFRGNRESKRQRRQELEWQIRRARQVLEELVVPAGQGARSGPGATFIGYAEKQSTAWAAS